MACFFQLPAPPGIVPRDHFVERAPVWGAVRVASADFDSKVGFDTETADLADEAHVCQGVGHSETVLPLDHGHPWNAAYVDANEAVDSCGLGYGDVHDSRLHADGSCCDNGAPSDHADMPHAVVPSE